MAGTPIVVSVTGGLQDQCGFPFSADDYIEIGSLHDKKESLNLHEDCKWAFAVWPAAININGSPLTPYIFDDRINDNEVADAIMKVYQMSKKERKERGLKGREWAIKNLSSKVMCDAMSEGIETTIKNYKPKERYKLYKIV
jgi:hypothetical protein